MNRCSRGHFIRYAHCQLCDRADAAAYWREMDNARQAAEMYRRDHRWWRRLAGAVERLIGGRAGA